MILCNFSSFFDKLSTCSRSSDYEAYPVRLSTSIVANYAEFSPYCSYGDFCDDSDSFVLMRNFIKEIERNRQKLCYSFIVCDRCFSLGRVYSCLYRSFYVRCIAFEHCGFSLVIMTNIPRKK